jgi:hypothetical protein
VEREQRLAGLKRSSSAHGTRQEKRVPGHGHIASIPCPDPLDASLTKLSVREYLMAIDQWQAIGLFVVALAARTLLKEAIGDVAVPVAMLLFGALFFMKPDKVKAAPLSDNDNNIGPHGLKSSDFSPDDYAPSRSGLSTGRRRVGGGRLGGSVSLAGRSKLGGRRVVGGGRSSIAGGSATRSLNRRVGQGWADARTGFGNPR